MSQPKFAKLIGVTPEVYAKYELIENPRPPALDVVVRIVEKTGHDVWWLLSGKTPSSRPVYPPTEHAKSRRSVRR